MTVQDWRQTSTGRIWYWSLWNKGGISSHCLMNSVQGRHNDRLHLCDISLCRTAVDVNLCAYSELMKHYYATAKHKSITWPLCCYHSIPADSQRRAFIYFLAQLKNSPKMNQTGLQCTARRGLLVLYLLVQCCLEALRKYCPLTWLAWPECNSMKDGLECSWRKQGFNTTGTERA